MFISMKWLARHVDLDGLSPEQIHNDLTLSTAEVEGVEVFGGGLDDIRVGKVIECGKHPEADRLSVTKVDVGDGALRQIVCGAPNVRQGLEVAVVQPGGCLPGDPKPLGKAKLRGVESFGMICSERELGLSDAHEGILELATGARPGTKIAEAVDVLDHVIEIDNKSVNHRPDLWGHRGIARELAAMHGRPLRPLGDDLPEIARQVVWPDDGIALPVEIADREGCFRYTGVVFDGVHAERSPDWLRYLLQACGVRAINQLVDITNFVLLDLGQPQHAFDLRDLDASKGIGVRRARNGETMTTLDAVERSLQEQDLVITANGDVPVALAGVMGGEGTMVRDDTASIFLESATFHASTVRRTSTRVGLRTDSSARFEKSLDPAMAELGAVRFATVLKALQPDSRIAGPLVDPVGFVDAQPTITLRRARLSLKLGIELGDDQVEKILTSLEFGVVRTADGFDVTVPSFRATKDVKIEDDLIEEVGRMVRYDNIPGKPLRGDVRVPHREPELWLARRARELCAFELGAHECYDYSFLHDQLVDACGLAALPHTKVTNPVTPESTRMRRHVLPSLLGNIKQNLLAGERSLRLFEIGKGYWPETRDQDNLPLERFELALVAVATSGESPYAALRGDVERALGRLGFDDCVIERLITEADPESVTQLPFVHPARTAAIERCSESGDRRICGFIGNIHPHVAKALDLPLEGVAVATLDLRALLANGRQDARYDRISPYPEQPVDVALFVPKATRVGDVQRFLAACGETDKGSIVRRIELFEVYTGEQVQEGFKSVNYTVTLGAMDRTLSAKDEERFLGTVRDRASELGGELRG